MIPIQRFSISVSTMTVVVMFCILEYLLPMLQSSAIPRVLLQYVPFPALILQISKIGLTALSTVGAYTLMSKTLGAFYERVPYLKGFIFGRSYMEGTWIGRFYAQGKPKFTVEHFEQKLDGIIIRGWASNEDGTRYAEWTSSAVAIDDLRGMLTYTYDCDLLGRNTPQQGIGVFQFERPKHWKAPTGITGYSADLTDGGRTENHESF